MNVNANSSPISVSNVQGAAVIHTSYKPVEVSDIQGRLSIRNGSGEVTVTEAGADVNIFTNYKTVQARKIHGDLTVDGGSSTIFAEEIAGDVDISNSYKYVVLKGTSGSIKVWGRNSPIEVRDIKKLPGGSRIELITTYKPITLELPGDAKVKVSAYTRYGKIYSDFPVYLKKSQERGMAIETGEGDIFVRLQTDQDITLKKK